MDFAAKMTVAARSPQAATTVLTESRPTKNAVLKDYPSIFQGSALSTIDYNIHSAII